MSATDRVLTLRELNRATLARQMLLDRQNIPVLDAVGRLAGLQAQVASPPYVGLWTRLQNFRREELTRLMEERQVVRATLMRATLHLMTAEDYLLLRPALQAALTRSMNSITGKRLDALDVGSSRLPESSSRKSRAPSPTCAPCCPSSNPKGISQHWHTR